MDSAFWYQQPAKKWDEALPLGNGSLGAMVHGRVGYERIALNLDTLWMGAPHDYDDPQAGAFLGKIRSLLFAGNESEAAELATRSFLGTPSCQAAYQPLGDLLLNEAETSEGPQYRRELDPATGIALTRYRSRQGDRRREVFVSFPDQVLVMRIAGAGTVRVAARLRTGFPGATGRHGQDIVLEGQWMNDGTERPWTADLREPGMKFAVGLRVIEGSAEFHDGQLHAHGEGSVTLLLAAETSFRNFKDIGGDPVGTVRSRLAAAGARSPDDLKKRHSDDVSSFMNRVSLEIGDPALAGHPVNLRLARVQGGGTDPGLEALLFQFGRYLLLSASRPGTQPANLQGIWNPDIAPAWGSKWTTNINLQMNYWPAETTNLSECHAPLFDLMDDLRETGARTAQKYYRAGGWVLHHNTDLWRGTAPVDGVWGVWAMGAAWLARHAWDHYLFSQDAGFLRERAWPLMKAAAGFLLDFLVTAPDGVPGAGYLVTCPSHSPENRFRKPDGTEGLFTHAATMDLMIIHDCFTNCVDAVAAMGGEHGEAGFCISLREALDRLAPLQISPRDGRLQEWIEDYCDSEPGHRHVSHAFGLFPGHQISPAETPELATAIRRTLDVRLENGGGGTGWSRAWLINLFARLGDGEAAHACLRKLLAVCTLPNLFNTHPPFQIDGNFGACAGVAEMLVQSRSLGREGFEVHLLPALPPAWASGSARGLRARGGFEVAITWSGGRLAHATVHSQAGRALRIVSGKSRRNFHPAAGGTLSLRSRDFA